MRETRPIIEDEYLENLENQEIEESSIGSAKNNVAEKNQPQQYEIMTDPEQRTMLAERTEKLVDKAAGENVKNMVFLDKSARPIATLFLDLWKKKFSDQEPPLINFLNVGKETSQRLKETMGKEYPTANYGVEDYIKALDKMSPEKIIQMAGSDEVERVKKEYAYLALAPDSTETLVIDEYSNTGESVQLAKKILQSVFPQLKINTFALAEATSWSDNSPGLFKDKRGVVNPPWRLHADNENYGLIGVVDGQESSLTATATRNMEAAHKIDGLDQAMKVKQSNMEFSLEGFPEMIANLPTEATRCLSSNLQLENTEHASSKGIEIAKRYLEKEIDPLMKRVAEETTKIAPLIETGIETASPEELASYMKLLESLEEARSKIEGWEEGNILAEQLAQEANYDNSTSVYNTLSAYGNKTADFYTPYRRINNIFEQRQAIKQLSAQKENIGNVNHQPNINNLRREMHNIAEEYWAAKVNNKAFKKAA